MREFLEPATLAGHLALTPARAVSKIALTFLPLAIDCLPAALRDGRRAENCLAACLNAESGAAVAARAPWGPSQ